MQEHWTLEQYREYKNRGKRSKYNATKTNVDGHTFDSKKEADYYSELKLRLQAKDNCIVTCWEMSNEEKKEFEKTGKIWLTVIGLKHPPVCMSVEQPYSMTQNNTNDE